MGDKSAAPWRSNKTATTGSCNPEPSVKVVNVAVENSNSMRFSESAEAQMAKHLKQTTSSFEQQCSSSSSMHMMTSTATCSNSSATASEKMVVMTASQKSRALS